MEHVTMPPGLASPYDTHHNEDEAFYVLDGQVRFVCDGEWTDVVPGRRVCGPRPSAYPQSISGTPDASRSAQTAASTAAPSSIGTMIAVIAIRQCCSRVSFHAGASARTAAMSASRAAT